MPAPALSSFSLGMNSQGSEQGWNLVSTHRMANPNLSLRVKMDVCLHQRFPLSLRKGLVVGRGMGLVVTVIKSHLLGNKSLGRFIFF